MSRPPARSPRRGLLRAGIAVAVVAAVGFAGWSWWQGRGAASEGQWRTTEVQQGDIRVAISATGTLSATSTVTVGSQVSGQVTDVLVDFNDRVEKGQLIARIDPATYEAQIAQGAAQVDSARASLAQAEATLRNAQLDYTRKAELVERQLVARSDVDLARAARDQAQAQVASARASITQQTASTQTSRINLGRTEIRSPVDGVILTRTIEPGQTVAASLQAPELFTIAEDLAKMRIELAVDEADIGQVQVGQGVGFTADAFPNRQFRGTVEQVRLAATNTNNVVTYPVVVAVDNADGTLLPGLTVNAEIEVSRRDGVLKVSNAALRYKPSEAVASAQAATAGGPPGGQRGAGMVDELARTATALQLDATQQAAFDAAATELRERQAARQAAPAGEGNRMFGGGPGGPPRQGGMDPAAQAQMRQRMQQRMQQQFAAFRGTLDEAKRKRWDAAIAAIGNATFVELYRLVDGKPQPVRVRVGASDGTDTEIAGPVQAGDLVVTGERAPGAAAE